MAPHVGHNLHQNPIHSRPRLCPHESILTLPQHHGAHFKLSHGACPSRNTQWAENVVVLALSLCDSVENLSTVVNYECAAAASDNPLMPPHHHHMSSQNTNHHLPVLLLHQTLAAPQHIGTRTTHPHQPPFQSQSQVPAPLADPTFTVCHDSHASHAATTATEKPLPHRSCRLTLVCGSFPVLHSPISFHQNVRDASLSKPNPTMPQTGKHAAATKRLGS